jgi:uncharacterized membrane protein YkvA (DUF1232 family)
VVYAAFVAGLVIAGRRGQARALAGFVPDCVVLVKRLLGDRRVPRSRKVGLLLLVAYLASPIDLVPGIIPFAGQLDDAAVALLGLRFALRGLPPEVRAEHLEAVGIAERDLDHDLVTVRQGAGWLARRGGKLALRGGRAVGRTAWRVARGAARGAVRRIP